MWLLTQQERRNGSAQVVYDDETERWTVRREAKP